MSTFDPNQRGQLIKNVVGVISIKDIFEDIMQEELIDEDIHFDSTAQNNFNFLKKNKLSKQNIELKPNPQKEPLI